MGSIPSSRALLEVRILFIFYNGYLLFVQRHVPYACVRMIAAHAVGSAVGAVDGDEVGDAMVMRSETLWDPLWEQRTVMGSATLWDPLREQ